MVISSRYAVVKGFSREEVGTEGVGKKCEAWQSVAVDGTSKRCWSVEICDFTRIWSCYT